MNINRFRSTLIAASVAAVLGVGISACDTESEYPTADTRSDSMGAAVSDTAITAQIKAKLATDGRDGSSGISVETTNGVVTLSGSVADAASKASAERTARTIAGVKTVYNNLDTSATGTTMEDTEQAASDAWITTKVKSELLADSVSSGFVVSVKTTDGVVALEGTLQDQDAIDHVKQVAGGVERVASVDVSGLTIQR